jgi:hypothetical protein
MSGRGYLNLDSARFFPSSNGSLRSTHSSKPAILPGWVTTRQRLPGAEDIASRRLSGGIG